MKLKDLAVDMKSVWVPFDGVKGFEVELNYIPRTEMSRIVKDCQKTEFNRSSRQAETSLDEEKFLKKFVSRAIKNWKGLTVENINEFVPVETDAPLETEIPFEIDNAIFLVKESSLFDDWLNSKISDIESFR